MSNNRWSMASKEMARKLVLLACLVLVLCNVMLSLWYSYGVQDKNNIPVGLQKQEITPRIVETTSQSQSQQAPPQSPSPKMSDERIQFRFRARQLLLNCDKNLSAPKVKRPSYAYVGNDYFEVFLMRKVASSYLEAITSSLSPDQRSHYGFKGKPRLLLMTVRDPYTRMASGYIDRILTNQDELRLFTSKDVQNFWPTASALQLQAKCLNVVSFQQFAKYFIYFHKAGKFIDGHFQPMHAQCNPCNAKVDFILHLETLHEDLSYILKTLKLRVTLPPAHETWKILNKPERFKKALSVPNPCQSICSAYTNLWWSFHANGQVSSEFKFPLSGEMCEQMPPEEFSQLALEAHQKSRNRFNKSIQKRQMMVELFLQLPLEDRISIRDILAKDFLLFGYDPLPADLFPELVKGSKE